MFENRFRLPSKWQRDRDAKDLKELEEASSPPPSKESNQPVKESLKNPSMLVNLNNLESIIEQNEKDAIILERVKKILAALKDEIGIKQSLQKVMDYIDKYVAGVEISVSPYNGRSDPNFIKNLADKKELYGICRDKIKIAIGQLVDSTKNNIPEIDPIKQQKLDRLKDANNPSINIGNLRSKAGEYFTDPKDLSRVDTLFKHLPKGITSKEQLIREWETLIKDNIFVNEKEYSGPNDPAYLEAVIAKKKLYRDLASKIIQLIGSSKKENLGDKPKDAEVLNSTEQQNLFQKLEFRGNYQNENGEVLTSGLIEKYGLLPKYPITIGDKKMYLSDSYICDEDGRVAAIYYIEVGETLVPRTIYKSNSQGIARVLPMSVADEEWHYDKGFGEDSLTVPNVVQKVFATDSLKVVKNNLPNNHQKLLFRGPTKVVNAPKSPLVTYTIEVESSSKYLEGINPNRIKGTFQKQDPKESILKKESYNPNFNRIVDKFKSTSSLAGSFDSYLINSRDETLQYMFCVDAQKRVWIANIEVIDSKVGNTGLRQEWAEGGALTTPIYEYVKQSGSYGNMADQKGNYISMWPNYLSKIPIIQEFQKKVLKP